MGIKSWLFPDDYADLLPFRALRDGLLVGADFSVMGMLRVRPPDPLPLADAAREDRHERLSAWLDGLDGEVRVQVWWTLDETLPEPLAETADPASGPPALVRYVQERRAALRQGFQEGRLRRPEVLLGVGVPALVGASERRRVAKAAGGAWWRPWEAPDEHFRWTEEQWRRQAAKTEQVLGQAARTWGAWGWAPERLGDDALRACLYRHQCRRAVARGELVPAARPDLTLGRLLAGTDWAWTGDGPPADRRCFRVDGCWHGLLTVDLPPERLGPDHWAEFPWLATGSAAEILWTARPTALGPRLRRLEAQLRRARARAGPAEESLRQELAAELEALGSRRSRLWRATGTVHAWDMDRERLLATLEDLRGWASQQGGMRLVPEENALLWHWRETQPGWLGPRDPHRELDYTSRQLAALLPLLGNDDPWAGAPGGAVVAETLARSVWALGAGGPRLSSPHVLVVGASGSGKSMWVNDLLAHAAAGGARAVVVDFLSSYRGLAEAAGWRHLALSRTATGVTLNPLQWTGDGPPDRDAVAAAAAFVERLVTGGDPAARLEPGQRALLEDRLGAVYARAEGREATLGELREELGRHRATGDLAARLARATGRGSLAALFDGPGRIDLDAPGLVFDLARVADDPELGGLCFAAVLQVATQVARRARDRRVILVFEEFARLARDPGLFAFAEAAFRVHRKLGVLDVGVSQTLDDFRPDGAPGVVANVDTIVLFRQPAAAAVEALGPALGLTAVERAWVRALETVPGQYATFLVREQGPGGVRTVPCVHRPTPFGWALTTTAPQDLAKRARYEEESGDLLAAVERLAAEGPDNGGRRRRTPL